MKRLIALCALVMLASCGSDDDKNVSSKKLMTAAIIDGDALLFNYDANKNLKTLTADDEVFMTFEYDNSNNLIAISDEDNTDAPIVSLQYENGKLVSFINNNVTFPVTYDEQAQKYIVGLLNMEAGITGRDLAYVGETGGDKTLEINYAADKKGPFYNVPTKNTFLYGLLVDLYYFTSTRPIASIMENGETLTAENTYDDEGYVTKMTLKSADNEVQAEIVFQYAEI